MMALWFAGFGAHVVAGAAALVLFAVVKGCFKLFRWVTS